MKFKKWTLKVEGKKFPEGHRAMLEGRVASATNDGLKARALLDLGHYFLQSHEEMNLVTAVARFKEARSLAESWKDRELFADAEFRIIHAIQRALGLVLTLAHAQSCEPFDWFFGEGRFNQMLALLQETNQPEAAAQAVAHASDFIARSACQFLASREEEDIRPYEKQIAGMISVLEQLAVIAKRRIGSGAWRPSETTLAMLHRNESRLLRLKNYQALATKSEEVFP